MYEKKNELRQRLKEILSHVSSSDFDKWNISLSENLNKLLTNDLNVMSGDVVGGFAPIKREPIWMSGVADKAILAFPAFKEKMFFQISDYESLEKRQDFGVEILSPPVLAIKSEPKVLLIPGLAFCANGKRLGRGKGFYDRYLEHYSGIKVGLCFECQFIDEIPTETHDQKMNFIVTEKNIYPIRS